MNTTQAQRIQNLCRPDCYPHPVGKIELIETHISWILLTGLRVYKIKKPVDLGFVDFSTLEKRKTCCHEEIRLNRRYAEELYLDVVAVSGSESAPRIDGTGPVLEFAVMMKQFSQEHLLSKLIKNDLLHRNLVDRLAVRIGQFHQQVDIAGASASWGSPASVYQPVADNFEVLQQLGHDQEQIEQLQDWSRENFERHKADFWLRKDAGKIRECHGDLHLGNLFLWGEDVVPFDGIEFNPALRWIDMLNEVAFLVMDLTDRGRSDYAHRVLNAYLEVTCDYEGLNLLRFYLVYRALVRAKVAAIRLGQERATGEDDENMKQEFVEYLDLAEQYTHPYEQKLMITHGVSGSGKTTGTWNLIEQTGAIRLRSDIIRKHLFAESDTRSNVCAEPLYSATATEQTYNKLLELSKRLLTSGYAVIVDATFLRRQYRERFGQLAQQQNVPFEILHFEAPPDVLKQRVAERAHRGQDASDADVSVLLQQLEKQEALTQDELQHVRPMETRCHIRR